MRRTTTIRLVAAFFLVLNTSSEARVKAPPLPNPMPPIAIASCPGAPETDGCYRSDVNQIWLRRRAGAFMLAHELGHAFDAQRLDDGERHRFARLVDALDAPWLPSGDYDLNLDYAGEDFADTYAECWLGYRRANRKLCRFIRRAAD